MRTVLFIAPFLLDATLRYVQAAAAVADVRLIVLTQDGPERLPHGVQHWHVPAATEAGALIAAARDIARLTGGIHRVIGILENCQEQIALVREALGIPGTGSEVARRFRDKAVMKDCLRAAGLPCARHRLLTAEGQAWEFAREVGFPLVLKPPAGAGCRATYQVNDWEALRAALAEVQPRPEREVLVEEFVMGEEFSYDTITIRGRQIFHNVLRYLPGPLDVMRNEWIQWCALAPRDISEYDPVRKVGNGAIAALGLETSMTHMEWFRRKDGSPVISEIGARPPGAQFTSVMSYCFDRSVYHAWAQAMIDEALPGPFERKYAVGIAFLRGVGQGRVTRVDNLDAAQQKVGALVVEARLPVVGAMRAAGYEGEGFAIVRHPDTAVVQAALKTLIETIKVHYQ
jgi:phosphoribosylaminoimidazole carboxylase (NCAIR synthetase)